MAQKPSKKIVCAYGFDKLGLGIAATVETEAYVLKFESYDTAKPLENADGIVIPSGIFEIFERHSTGIEPYTTCESDTHRMAEIEKQVFNAIERGSWVCFLLRELNNGYQNKWWNTDLAKKLTNQMFEYVGGHDPNPHVESKVDEFRDFFHRHGIGRTTMATPRKKSITRVLATSLNGEEIFSAEVGGKFFFLPFKSIPHSNPKDLVALVESAARCVISYKQRNDLYLPTWIESIGFKTEAAIVKKIKALEERLIDLKAESVRWENYKAILCASGRSLNEAVVAVLRTFFLLNLKSDEAYIEDALIYDSKGNPKFVVEIKGVNGGVKRDHINQVDSHRERLSLPPSLPGLLIVNDFADIAGYDERKAKSIDPLHVDLARKQNVRILRTTTLLDFMLEMEDVPDRSGIFLSACLAGDPLVKVPTK